MTALVVLATSCASLGKLAAAAIEGAAADAVPHGEVRGDAFYSSALGVRKHLMVYLPASYRRDTTRRFPVAYYLHGLNGGETDWLSHGSIDTAADSVFAQGTPEMVLVMPDGDDGWYADWTSDVSFSTCADTIRSEGADRYCVRRARYEEYVTRDVVGYVDSRYRTRADRDHRGIAGLSMGGYGAMILSLRHPDLFAAAASHSGVVGPTYVSPHPFAAPPRYAATIAEVGRARSTSYWQWTERAFGDDLDHWRDEDPAHVAATLVRRGASAPALFFDCGREDALIDQNRALDWELTRLGVRHHYAEWPGAHTWRYWSTHVPESLVWLSREIGH